MKAVIVEKTGTLSVREKPVPKLDPGDVLITVDLCGTCPSDLGRWWINITLPEIG